MATLYAPRIVTDGLVLCLDAANRKSYPGSGTAWNDLSGNNNTGTLTNGPTFDSANGGNIVFDGTNDRVALPDVGVTENSAFSISFWAKKSNATTSPTIYSEGTPSSWANNLFIIYFGDALIGNACRIWFGNSNRNITTTPVTDGKWYFITYNQTTTNSRNLYTNTILEGGTNTTSITSHSVTNASIGAANNNGTFTQFSNASLAYLFTYNRALSEQEVLQNYNATRSRFGI
jgi:hypothetical protein